MSRIHDLFVARLSKDDRERYYQAVESGVCWRPDCSDPTFSLFRDSPAYQCSKCGIENLARGIEAEWEGDSIEEIHQGEQLGALIRDMCGISPNAPVLPPRGTQPETD